MTFAILRTAGLLGLGWLFVKRGGSGVLGATLGFVAAAACIVPLGAALDRAREEAGPESSPTFPAPGEYLMTLAPLAIAQLFTNMLMQVDITLLGRFLSGSTPHRLVGADAAAAADEWVAVYRACQLFAFLPYQLLFSVTQVLFPLVARAHAGGRRRAGARVRRARGADRGDRVRADGRGHRGDAGIAPRVRVPRGRRGARRVGAARSSRSGRGRSRCWGWRRRCS